MGFRVGLACFFCECVGYQSHPAQGYAFASLSVCLVASCHIYSTATGLELQSTTSSIPVSRGRLQRRQRDSGPNQHRSLAWRRQSPVAKWHRPVGLQKLSRIPLFGVSFRQSLGVRALGACAQRQVLSHAKHDRPARQWWRARAVSFFRWLCKELQPKFVMTFPPRLPQMHHACFHYLLRLEGYVELLHMHDKRCPQHARQSKLGLERSHKILEMATLVPVREREREIEPPSEPRPPTPPNGATPPPHAPERCARHNQTRNPAGKGQPPSATGQPKANNKGKPGGQAAQPKGRPPQPPMSESESDWPSEDWPSEDPHDRAELMQTWNNVQDNEHYHHRARPARASPHSDSHPPPTQTPQPHPSTTVSHHHNHDHTHNNARATGGETR